MEEVGKTIDEILPGVINRIIPLPDTSPGADVIAQLNGLAVGTKGHIRIPVSLYLTRQYHALRGREQRVLLCLFKHRVNKSKLSFPGINVILREVYGMDGDYDRTLTDHTTKYRGLMRQIESLKQKGFLYQRNHGCYGIAVEYYVALNEAQIEAIKELNSMTPKTIQDKPEVCDV